MLPEQTSQIVGLVPGSYFFPGFVYTGDLTMGPIRVHVRVIWIVCVGLGPFVFGGIGT